MCYECKHQMFDFFCRTDIYSLGLMLRSILFTIIYCVLKNNTLGEMVRADLDKKNIVLELGPRSLYNQLSETMKAKYTSLMEQTQCQEDYRKFMMQKQRGEDDDEDDEATIASEIYNEIDNPQIRTVLEQAKSHEGDERMLTLWEMATVRLNRL